MSTLREKYLGTENSKTLRKKYEEELKKQSQVKDSVNKLFYDNGVMANTDSFSTQRITLPVQQQQETVKNGFKVNQDSLRTNVEKENTFRNVLNSNEYKKKENELIDQSNKVGYAKYDYDKSLVDEDKIGWFDKSIGVLLGGGKSQFDKFTAGTVKDENGNVIALPNKTQMKQNKTLESYNTKLGKLWGQVGYEIGKIGSTTAINTLLPGVGTGIYYSNMFIDSTNNAMADGYDSGKAVAYGAAITAFEYLVGKGLGSATKGLTGGKSSTYEKALNKLFGKVAKNELVSKILANAGSEATEEFIQEYLDNLAQLALLENSKNIKDYVSVFTNPEILSDAAYAALIGSITGATLGTMTGQDTNVTNKDITNVFKEQLEETKNNTTDSTTISQIDEIINNIDNNINSDTNNTSVINEIAEITNQLEEFHNLQNQNRLTRAQEQQMTELQERLNELQNTLDSQESTIKNTPMTVNDVVEQENANSSSNINLPNLNTNANGLNLPTVNDLVKSNTNTNSSSVNANIPPQTIAKIKAIQNNKNQNVKYTPKHIATILRESNIEIPSSFSYVKDVNSDLTYTTTRELTPQQRTSIDNVLSQIRSIDINSVNNSNRLLMPVVDNKLMVTGENISNNINVPNRNIISDNLLTFNDNEKNAILRGNNNVIVNSKEELRQYVLEALNDKTSKKNLYLGVIPNETIQRIKNEVTNIKEGKINEFLVDNKNYDLAINQEEIRHLAKESLTEEDVVDFVDSLDELIASFDTVRYTVYNNNQNALRFKKKMQDGVHIALEVISKQKGTFRTHTLFLEKADFIAKKRNISPMLNELNNSLSKTSEMDGGLVPFSANNIPQSNEIVKSDILPTTNNMQNSSNDTQNTSNMPVNQNTDINIDEDIEKLASILQERPTTEKEKNSRLLKLFNIKFLDKGYYVDKLARKQKNRELSAKYDYMLSANGIAQQIIGNERFNPKTQKNDGKGLYKIFEPIENSGKLNEFSDYIYHKHNIDRMNLSTLYQEDNKPIFGDSVTSEKSKDIVEKYEKENPEFVEWAKDIYDYNNFLLDVLVDYGVIDKESKEYYNKKYPNYVPTIRDTDKTKVQMDFLGKNASINSPIKKAKGGNQDIIPLKEAMSLRTMQTINSALRNNFGNELLNTIETEAEKSAIPLDDVIGDEMDVDDLLTKSTNKKSATLTVFKDGQKVTFGIPDEIYEALAPSTRVRINALNKISQIRRALTTNYNPAFALTNPIKDVQDGIINSKHPALFTKNVAEAAMQIKNKGDLYKLYLANGGSYETYFNYGKGYNKIPQQRNKFSPMKIIDKINSLNESIEMAPRLAEFIASLEAGDSIETAMYNAQEITTNFKRGGDITKNLDANGATFLNAGVQGTLKQVRNIQDAKTQGIRGMTSLAVKWSLVGLGIAVLNDMIWGDDDDYDDLSDYVKNNYYILWKYGDGKYVRIPKGRVMSVIQNAFQQIVNKSKGEKLKINEFIDLLQNQILPNDPTESNIFSPFVDVAKNKTWYGGDLIPQRLQQLPDEEQYDEGTDSISIWLGKKLKISPKKINYILDQYSGAIGDMILPALTLKAENESNSFLSTLLSPLNSKFTTDSVINNQNISDLYDLDDVLTKKAKSSNATDEDVLRSKYINSIQTKMNKLTAEKRNVQNDISLTNNEKYEQVKEIQKRINDLAKEGLDSYDDISIKNNYASVSNNEYYKNTSGEWQKLDTTTANYKLSKQIGSYDKYLTYKNEIDNLKDTYKNTNDRKNAVINYVNSLDLSIPQKAMLIKMNYSSFKNYDNEIINYIVNQNDLMEYEKTELLEKLGFKVRNGRVYTK